MLLALTVMIYQSASSAMLPFLAEARTAAGSDSEPDDRRDVRHIPRLHGAGRARGRPMSRADAATRGVMTIVLAMIVVRAGLAYFAHSWAVVAVVELLEGLSVGMALVAIPVPQRRGDGRHGPGQRRPRPGAHGVRRGGRRSLPSSAGFVAGRFGFGGAFIAYAIIALFGLVTWTGGRRLIHAESGLEPTLEETGTGSASRLASGDGVSRGLPAH